MMHRARASASSVLRPLSLAACIALALATPLATPLVAQEAPGARNVTVRVVTALERAPLGYSVVAIPALELERFTAASGVVVMPVPAPGQVRLRVKRLGFTPKDTTITVTDAAVQSVTIALARVSFRLDAVQIVAWPPCLRPGITGETDAQLRGIVDQLRQNAERYRLLTRSYPFVYTVRRQFGERATDGSVVLEFDNVSVVSGTPEWTYRPGTLIAREPSLGGGRRSDWIMRIPSISDLAEDAFVDNHCFHVAGLEEKEGQRLLRLDIVAAERLKGVDVNVVAWLDPQDFQLRHATFTLTKPPPQVRGLLHSSSRVTYRELIPFVPVHALTVAENTIQQGRSRTATKVMIERQVTERVLFRGARPEGLALDSLR
jgi:hypothetical protein